MLRGKYVRYHSGCFNSYLDKVFAMKTCNAFSDILKNTSSKQVLMYFGRIVEMLESVSLFFADHLT